MLPKSELTKLMMTHLYLFKGQYHNLKVPQFMPHIPPDPNEYMGYDAIDPTTKIIYSSPGGVPDELKHLPVELDPLITTPDNYFEQVAGRGKRYIYVNSATEAWGQHYKRYKTTRKEF